METTTPPDRVLILSATTGYQLRSFDHAARRLDIDLVFATDRCHQLDERIVAAMRHAPVQGLVVVGDRPAVLAARVSERLGLRGNPQHAAIASANKYETRLRFQRAGLAVPWFFTTPLAIDEAALANDARVSYPCVLKPLALSGSRGVIRADSPQEFEIAFARVRALLRRIDIRAARSGLDDEVLVEGFIPGSEYAIEGVLTEGRFQAFAIFDKPDPLVGPFFEETIYVTPSALSGLSQVSVLRSVEAAAVALGLWHGPIHAECRISADGIVMLEVAPRPIGGLCSKVLRFAGGLTLEQVLLQHAVGDDISGCLREASASAVMMIPIPARGVFKKVSGEDAARRVPGVEDVVITAKPDQLLEPLPEAGSYLGFIFARAATAGRAERAVREAHRLLRFTIDPEIRVAVVESA
jgi:biotin carboxylase